MCVCFLFLLFLVGFVCWGGGVAYGLFLRGWGKINKKTSKPFISRSGSTKICSKLQSTDLGISYFIFRI